MTTTSESNARPRGWRRLPTAIARRWPTALAVLMSVNSFIDEVSDSLVRSFAEAMLLLPMMYVVMVALRRRRLTWLVLVVSLVGYVGLRLQDRIDPSIVIVAVALAAAIWSTRQGHYREREFWIQLAGMVGFGALAVAGQLVDPDLALYIVAAGWFAHGIWDIVHLVKDRVVSRTWAEWCAVVDILIAVSLLIGPLLR